jgi:hypothetical protein
MPAEPITLIEAVASKRLLGSFVPRPAQRELLGAVDSGPRVQVVRWGRRGGKTAAASVAMVANATLRPDLDERMPGSEIRYVLAIATRSDQATLLIDYARELVKASPVLRPMLTSDASDELAFALPGGHRSVIKAMPCSARGSRGWTVSMLVADELAHFVDSEGNASADAVLKATLPSLATFGDDARALLISTPSGDGGAFHTYSVNAASGAWPWVREHHASTKQANPEISDALLEQERQRDPVGFASEYLAQFLAGDAAFIDVDRLIIADRGELSPSDCDTWYAGLDPGFTHDPFAICLVGRDSEDRLCLGLAHALMPERTTSFEDRRGVEDERLATVAGILKSYGVTRALADQYASAPIQDRLARLGVELEPFALTQESKAAVFRELRESLNAGALELYQHPRLLGELRRLAVKYTPRGPSVLTPRVGTSHCDVAVSLALAVQASRSEIAPAAVKTMVVGGFSTGQSLFGSSFGG